MCRAGERGDDAAGDDLARVRHAGAGRVAGRGAAAAVAHAAAQALPQALRARDLRLPAAARADAAGPHAGARPRAPHHGRRRAQQPLAARRRARPVSTAPPPRPPPPRPPLASIEDTHRHFSTSTSFTRIGLQIYFKHNTTYTIIREIPSLTSKI